MIFYDLSGHTRCIYIPLGPPIRGGGVIVLLLLVTRGTVQYSKTASRTYDTASSHASSLFSMQKFVTTDRCPLNPPKSRSLAFLFFVLQSCLYCGCYVFASYPATTAYFLENGVASLIPKGQGIFPAPETDQGTQMCARTFPRW
jgi:hypothetical protein